MKKPRFDIFAGQVYRLRNCRIKIDGVICMGGDIVELEVHSDNNVYETIGIDDFIKMDKKLIS